MINDQRSMIDQRTMNNEHDDDHDHDHDDEHHDEHMTMM
jgi:hypothetical protein|nr:MAG TPA: Thiamine transporter protein, transporter, native-SAD phasing [Caudoviricetes sp.]